ncbi:MAG: hydrogenase 3 maturation endopeptidase HyCI [Candidatus Omnitrophota bacterium]|jgi:hydrogenase 3 maturation protease
MLEHLKSHLAGKAVILGIGNTFRGDDGIGSLLAQRLRDKSSFIVYDAGPNPENYLGKIIKDKPDNIIIIDAVDFGGPAGGFREMEGKDIETTNLFSTHNASISLTINYLKNNLKADIIILIIQPKDISFTDNLTPELAETLDKLENWFLEQGNSVKR